MMAYRDLNWRVQKPRSLTLLALFARGFALARPSFGRKTHQNVHRNNARVSITRRAKVLRDNP
jgi:hypothetical protein